MKIHATIIDRPPHVEMVDDLDRPFVPGLAVSVSELVRRQALGLPMGVGVHGVTNIPEGISYEDARAEALRYIRMNEIRQAEAAAAAAAAAAPQAPPEPAS